MAAGNPTLKANEQVKKTRKMDSIRAIVKIKNRHNKWESQIIYPPTFVREKCERVFELLLINFT